MRSWLGVVTLGVLIVACGTQPGSPAAPAAGERPTASAAPSPGPEPELDDVAGPLPAGLYFAVYHGSSDQLCPECPVPGVAVVAEVTPDAARVDRVVAALPPLVPGYPMLAHTEELGLADATLDGIAIVLGLFVSETDAGAWLAGQPGTIGPTRTLPLLAPSAAYDRLPMYTDPKAPQRSIVRIAPGWPVDGYDPDAVNRAIEAGPRDEDPARVNFGRLRPVCKVEPGRFAIAPAFWAGTSGVPEVADAECGGRKVMVRWQDVIAGGATVLRDSDGTYLLRHVIASGTDGTTLYEWAYDERGRRGDPSIHHVPWGATGAR